MEKQEEKPNRNRLRRSDETAAEREWEGRGGEGGEGRMRASDVCESLRQKQRQRQIIQ